MKQFGKHSNTFYRLAKRSNFRAWVIYDFHTSYPKGKPYYWIESFEVCKVDDMNQNGEITRCPCAITRKKDVQKEDGNAFYTQLKNDGFIVIGKFEQDIYGEERRI